MHHASVLVHVSVLISNDKVSALIVYRQISGHYGAGGYKHPHDGGWKCAEERRPDGLLPARRVSDQSPPTLGH